MKSICKLSKSDLAEFLPQLCEDLPECKYVCKKCGRVAVKKGRLCKPLPITQVAEKASAGEADEADLVWS